MIKTKVTANASLARVDSSSFASCQYLWIVLAEKGFEMATLLSRNQVSTNKANLGFMIKNRELHERTAVLPSNIYYN